MGVDRSPSSEQGSSPDSRSRTKKNSRDHVCLSGFFRVTTIIALWTLLGMALNINAYAGSDQLDFDARVHCQQAIERVYYSHRIGTKIPFEQAVPRGVLEQKVRRYLKESAVLQGLYKTAVTKEALAREVERIKRDTRMPERLQEVYDALGNEPVLVSECLTRPILAERLLHERITREKEGYAWAREAVGRLRGRIIPGWLRVLDQHPLRSLIELTRSQEDMRRRLIGTAVQTGLLSDYAHASTPDTWQTVSMVNAPSARELHAAVWTGSEMIVWGGREGAAGPYLYTGGLYNPVTDSWTSTSTVGAPSPRYPSSAVWTGSEMIVWGGYDGGNLNTGGRYDPVSDSWSAMSTTGAPSGRSFAAAVWTGTEMIVWGGSSYTNTGGRYNPSTDTWQATSTVNAPVGRSSHTAVWTGNEMIVWGGADGSTYFNTGGRYRPATDSWQATSTIGAPSARVYHTAVWTGSKMVVWGGSGTFFKLGELNTGGSYNPTTNTWQSTSTVNAPDARQLHTAVWNGLEMVVWGGASNDNTSYLSTGGRYLPTTDSWHATSAVGAADARRQHTAVWTGDEMVVWGGEGSSGLLDTGGRYSTVGFDIPALSLWGLSLFLLLALTVRVLSWRRKPRQA